MQLTLMTVVGLAAGVATSAAPELEITDQSTFVQPDGTLWFDLKIDLGQQNPERPNPERPNLQDTRDFDDDRAKGEPFVSVTVHGVLGAEDDLDEPLPPVINRTAPMAISEIERPNKDHYRITVPIRSGPSTDGRRLLLNAAGIYPITVELRTEQGTIATARTNVVRLPTSAPDPQPSANAEAASAAGAVAFVLRVSTDGPLTITRATDLLRSHPTTPLTVLFEPGVLARLTADRSLAGDLADAIGGRPVLVTPYPELDPSALAEIDHADIYANAVAGVTSRLEELGLVPADGVHVTRSRPTSDGIGVLEDVGVRSILNTDGTSTGGGTAGGGILRSNGAAVQILTVDRELSRLVAGGGGQHRANRLLTRLTLDHQASTQTSEDDTPQTGRQAAVVVPVIITPQSSSGGGQGGLEAADEELASTMDAVLRTLAQPGAPNAILLSDAAGISWAETRIGPAERPTQDLRPVAAVLAAVRDKIRTYESFDPGATAAGNPAIADAGVGRPLSAAQLRSRIPEALGRDRTPQQRLRALEVLDTSLDGWLSVIELHDGQPVTLAARSAPIPVILESAADGPRQVMLRIRSDRVSSVDNERVVEVSPGTSSIDVELETRSLGVSPLEVSVWTPDGTTMLAATRFEVRSTAIPGLGLALTAGAVGLLGAWWVIDAGRRRREADQTEMNLEVSSGSV